MLSLSVCPKVITLSVFHCIIKHLLQVGDGATGQVGLRVRRLAKMEPKPEPDPATTRPLQMEEQTVSGSIKNCKFVMQDPA
jgi:hypothetical protein